MTVLVATAWDMEEAERFDPVAADEGWVLAAPRHGSAELNARSATLEEAYVRCFAAQR